MIKIMELKSGKKSYKADFKKGKVRLSKTFGKRSEAKTWLSQMEIKYNQGEVRKKSPAFGDLYKSFIDYKIKLSAKSKSQYETDFNNYYNPLLGQDRIDSIGESHYIMLQNYCISEKLQNRTINAKMDRFKTIIKYAANKDLIRKYPFSMVEDLEIEENEFNYWETSDINKFHKLPASKEKLFFLVLLNSGMRLGELAGLKVGMVDFNRKLIKITKSLKNWNTQNTEEDKLIMHGERVSFVLGKTKTRSSNRTIPLTSTLEKLLRELINERKSGLVYEQNKRPMPVNNANGRIFQKLAKLAGVSNIINIHDLRHTFASHFVMSGGHLYVLKSILGHKSYETTTIYAHLSPVHELEQMNIIKFE